MPLPALHSPLADGTSELLSNLLTSVLPNVRDAKTVAVTISDAQWEDVLWDREEEEKERERVTSAERREGEGDEGRGKRQKKIRPAREMLSDAGKSGGARIGPALSGQIFDLFMTRY